MATLALYIAPFGKDLYASWDTFVLPKISRVRVAIALLLIIIPIFSCMLVYLLGQITAASFIASVSSLGTNPFGVPGSRNLPPNPLSGLTGLLGIVPALLLCCLCPLSTISLLVLPPAFVISIYHAVVDLDPFALLRGNVSEFQQDDIIALEQAVHHTVLQTLDEIGIDTKIIPEATFNGVRRRVI